MKDETVAFGESHPAALAEMRKILGVWGQSPQRLVATLTIRERVEAAGHNIWGPPTENREAARMINDWMIVWHPSTYPLIPG